MFGARPHPSPPPRPRLLLKASAAEDVEALEGDRGLTDQGVNPPTHGRTRGDRQKITLGLRARAVLWLTRGNKPLRFPCDFGRLAPLRPTVKGPLALRRFGLASLGGISPRSRNHG